MRARNDALFVAVALAAHVAVAAFVLREPPRAVTAAPPFAEEAPLEVAIEEESPLPASPAGGAGEIAGVVVASVQPTRIASAPTTSSAVTAGEHAEEPAPQPSGSPPAIVIPVPAGSAAIGLGGLNPFLPKSEAALPREGRPGRAASVERSMAEAAHEHDVAIGLGPDGPVLSALAEATAAGTTPVKGHAIFVATAIGGELVSIDLQNASEASEAWQQAARAALARMKGQKLRMPSTSRVAMTIEVVSEWKLPSGHDPGVDTSILGIPVTHGEGPRSTKVEILNPIPKLSIGSIDAGAVQIPAPMLQMEIVGIHGDLADIGASARRVIHARLLDSHTF